MGGPGPGWQSLCVSKMPMLSCVLAVSSPGRVLVSEEQTRACLTAGGTASCLFPVHTL